MPRKRKVVVKERENVEPKEKLVTKLKKSEQPAKKQKREPEFANGDGLNVIKILLSVQKNDCNSNRCLAELQKLYKKMSHPIFMKAFISCLQAFLIRDDSDDEYASRALKFIGVFVASYGEEVTESGASHPIVETYFKELLSSTAKLIHVRARICLLVTNTMASFSQKAELDEAIIEKITERMLFFMKDISPIVRAQAVYALQRLQDPENTNEDPVTKAYIYHMESDPAPKVRQAAVTAIAKKIHNIPSILERLHDVDEKVRRHTYLQMSSYSVKSYKIADRISILNAGLNDRSDIVKKAVSNLLLSNWIGVYDYDYAEFVRAIKLDSNENELVKFRNLAEKALQDIFKKRKINDLIKYLDLSSNTQYKNCLPLDKISLEILIVWKMIIKCHQDYVNGKRRDNEVREDDGGDDVDEDNSIINDSIANVEIIPELSVYCDFVESFVTDFNFGTELEAKYQKIYFSQCLVLLLEIVQLNDLDDEVGRVRLQNLLKTILSTYDLSEFAIQEASRAIEKIIPSVEQRLMFFNQVVIEMVKPGAPSEYNRQVIIDDLINRSDIDRKVKANDLKLRMMDLKEQESNLVQQKQYAECQKVSEEYHRLNEELVELLRPIAEHHSIESTQSLLENLSSVVNIKKITPEEVLKNLKICYFAIRTKGVTAITHEILQIYNEFVRYHLESTDLLTRIWALKTATAYSLLYESIAKEIYIIIKSQVFKSTHVLLWECSIQCIFDLLLRYNIEKMDANDNDTTNMSINTQNRSKRGGRTLYTDVEDEEEDAPDEMHIIKSLDIMQMLSHLMEQSVDLKILKVLINGFCKLILHGAFCTREIMSKFLLMYFNPATSAEISQILGIFLENIIKRKKQECLHEALVPTIFTLAEAPYDSPLREVKLETVLKYIVGATRPIFCSNGLNLHNTIATEFLDIMKENPDCKDLLKIFAKEISELEIGEDPLLKRDMTKQIEVILKESTIDQRTKKHLTDFCKMLNGTYQAPLEFSSTAKAQNDDEDEDDNEERLDNIEEDNEEDNEKQIRNESKFDETTETITNISISKVKMKDFDLKIKKVAIPDENLTISQFNVTPTKHTNVVDESIAVSSIPPSPEHYEIPATQEENLEIPATQKLNEDLSSDDDDSVISVDVTIPSTPSTPMTVIKKKPTVKMEKGGKLSLSVQEEHEEYPPTPIASVIKSSKSNGKRHLESSHSTPITPSQSSPLRKNPRKFLITSRLQSASPKSPVNNLPRSKASTPNTEGRMTRNQSKIETAQNITVTRSASKILAIKPSAAALLKPKENESDSETKKSGIKSSKLPVKKSSTASTTKTSQEPTRSMRTRTQSNQSVVKQKDTKSRNERPPWK